MIRPLRFWSQHRAYLYPEHGIKEFAERSLGQIDSILRQNQEFENNFYKLKSIEHWDEVNAFKTIKENFNRRQKIAESLDGHFSHHYDLFQAEARKRYIQDRHTIPNASIRTLNRMAGNGSQPVHEKERVKIKELVKTNAPETMPRRRAMGDTFENPSFLNRSDAAV